MRAKEFKAIVIIVLSIGFAIQAFPQKGVEDGSQYGKGKDSIECIKNISLYSEFFKHENYYDAISPWREVFHNCPASRESLYANGVAMYKTFIEQEKDPLKKTALCDTIMMIYDQRIKYFGDEGNVLGRKGVDLLRYRREEGINFIEEGYRYLKKSVEIEKSKSSPAVLTTFVSASISLYMRELITKEQVVMDYLTAADILDNELSVRPTPKAQQAKDAIDLNIKESKALSCELIIKIFEPKFAANENNPAFLKKVTGFLSDAECETEKLFADASEKLYSIEPSELAAYKLARAYLQRKEFEKSTKYYINALELSVNTNDKATYNYELAFVYNNHLSQQETAVLYANEAIKLRPEWGDAYILLGSIYGASGNSFEDPFAKKTVYWLAVDMFRKAKTVDPGVDDKASLLITEYSAFFPGVEDVFFNGLAEGQSYTVGGWINKGTTVRARKQ